MTTTFLASSTRGAQLFLLTALVGSVIGFGIAGFTTTNLLMVLIGYFVYGCLGIVITYHRLLTHNSYKPYKFLERLFTIFGALGGTGSSLAWVAIHLNHHLNSDKPSDPHSPLYKGLGIFTLEYEGETPESTKLRMRKLVCDRFHQFVHRYYFGIYIVWDAILFLIGGWELVVFLHWAPAALTAIMSNVVNYVGHMPRWLSGFRSHNLNDRSSNNWLWAIPSWGEAWHNNHHRFPKNSYFGEKWWQLDISGLIIKLIRAK
jgi:fatty-acid desaturase